MGKKCNKCGKLNHLQKMCRTREAAAAAMILSCIERMVNASTLVNTLPKIGILMSATGTYVNIDCIADTGAQVSVGGLTQMTTLGISKRQLNRNIHILKHAGGRKLNVIGKFKVRFEHNNQAVTSNVYFVPEVKNMYLSLHVCRKLKLVHQKFPYVNVDDSVQKVSAVSPNETVNVVQCTVKDDNHIKPSVKDDNHVKPIVSGTKSDNDVNLPQRPVALPYPANDENMQQLEKWLLDTFRDHCFNVDREPMSAMRTKPLYFHL